MGMNISTVPPMFKFDLYFMVHSLLLCIMLTSIKLGSVTQWKQHMIIFFHYLHHKETLYSVVVIVFVMLLYTHGKQLWSCLDGQLT